MMRIYYFYAKGCDPCVEMSRVIEELELLRPEIPVIKVDLNDNMELFYVFNLEGSPTTILYENNLEVDRYVGAIPKMVLFNRIGITQ